MARVRAMPRLSVDLTGPKHPEQCQACGVSASDEVKLTRWREHDEDDIPEDVIIVLCKKCEKKLIKRHPRFYDFLLEHQPCLGCMPVCVACKFRDGVKCLHPDSKANKGPGVLLRFPQPTAPVHLNFGGGKGGWMRVYRGPVECTRREELKQDDQTTQSEATEPPAEATEPIGAGPGSTENH